MTFKKGEKKPNQGKRGPSKTTVLAREAISKLVDGNAERLQEWLDQVASDERHGPLVAFKLMMEVMEYHVPKLARTEHTGAGGGPVQTDNVWRLELVKRA